MNATDDWIVTIVGLVDDDELRTMIHRCRKVYMVMPASRAFEARVFKGLKTLRIFQEYNKRLKNFVKEDMETDTQTTKQYKLKWNCIRWT
jgi:hypothetical protein